MKRKKYKRTFQLNLIKKDYPYSVAELVQDFGVTKGTVYAWIHEGLQPTDGTTPYLIHSEVLREFLRERQKKRKKPCEFNQMFCLKCQRPRRTLEGKATLEFGNHNAPKLKGICEKCNGKVCRSYSAKSLPEVRKAFSLQQVDMGHLVVCSNTPTN